MDPSPPSSPRLAYGVALAGIALFSVMDMVIKGASLVVGAYAVLWWRALATLPAAGALYWPQRRWPGARLIRLHALRGLIGSAMAFTFFWGLARVPMAQAVGLTFIAPLVAMGLAAAFLRETIGPRLWAGSGLGLAGVVLILMAQARAGDGLAAGESASLLAGSASILCSALLYAVNIILMRLQAVAAGPREVGFYQSAFMAAGLSAALPFVGVPDWPAGQVGAILLAAGLGLGSMMLLAHAYARGPASLLATTEYSSLVYAIVLGWLAFGERVQAATLAGAAAIVAGCMVAASGRGRLADRAEDIDGEANDAEVEQEGRDRLEQHGRA